MRIALNLIALVLLGIQILAYVGNPDLGNYAPAIHDSPSVAQWLGAFVGSNLFGLVGLALLLFANIERRRSHSTTVLVDGSASEPDVVKTEPEDDKDTVWEELKEWPTEPEDDGTKK